MLKRMLWIVLPMVLFLAGCATEAELNQQAGISAEQAGDNVRLVLPATVLFRTDEASLLPAAEKSLKRLVVLVNRSKSAIEVEGHTDNVGDHDYNQILSEKRAMVVAKRLPELGVAVDRISSKGFSYDKPIASNDTAEGRQKNRRTDIILSNEKLENIMHR